MDPQSIEELKKDLIDRFGKVSCNGDQPSKEAIRLLHKEQRLEILRQHRDFIEKTGPKLLPWFAHGSEVLPDQIHPRLVVVESGKQTADVFRLATLLWSVPVSHGYGRRVRFLVIDEANEKLIGIFALGDPVFNLRVRDEWIGWSVEQRGERLKLVMDAFVVGAVPPYTMMIGSKLVAGLMTSTEVRKIIQDRYAGCTGIISGKTMNGQIVLISATSALGRSSLYNRLNLDGHRLFSCIGTTAGFGHFAIGSDLFMRVREYLRYEHHEYADGHRFGTGPNWKIRVLRVGLKTLGLDQDLLKHGIRREVYLAPLASNWREILRGGREEPQWTTLPAEHISRACIARWMLPRTQRDQSFLTWHRNQILESLQHELGEDM